MGTSIEPKLDNGSRDNTRAFRSPRNGRYYIALTFEAFREHVRQRIGCISDCFILQVPSVDSALNAFSGYSSIRPVENEDKD